MTKYFGTDGIRGIANIDLSPELAYKVGKSLAYLIKTQKDHGVISIGRDTRVSGEMLEAALIAGITSMGINIKKLGILPTPAIAFITKEFNFDAGVVISASHNSFEYNGIKIFDKFGMKLSDNDEEIIEDYIDNFPKTEGHIFGENIGIVENFEEGKCLYSEYLKNLCIVDLKDTHIAIDCANGALYELASKILNDLGARVSAINCEPNGININKDCGSTHPEVISKFVTDINADIGFSFDGDADRIIIVDENGDIMYGDHIVGIAASYMKNKNSLKNNLVIGTTMTNIGLDMFLKQKNIDILKSDVGDRYVLEKMIEKDASLGGEQSGHIIFIDNNTTGDGIATGINILNIYLSDYKKVSDMNNLFKSFPQVIINANVSNGNKKDCLNNFEIISEIEKLEQKYSNNGRIIIRPSGTEPKIRVMIEGKNIEEISKDATMLAKKIENKFGGN